MANVATPDALLHLARGQVRYARDIITEAPQQGGET
jgi:hypothetical protein